MTSLAFAIVAAAVLAGEPGPADLVGLLGSVDRVEREEAARSLEEMGAEALPALRDAEKTAPAEVRSKAISIARAIEGKMLDRPSLVVVDFDGQPLDQAVRTLADRSGYALKLDNGKDAAMLLRPIHARASAPVPFWEALDLIGRAGHVRHNPGAQVGEKEPDPLLHLADGDPPANTLYRGPFRVHLVSVHRRRDLDLRTITDGQTTPRGTLYAEIQAFAEPGRFLDLDGTPHLEATDDRGRPLPPPPVNAEWTRPQSSHWNVPGAIGLLQWRLPLGLPDEQAVSILRLRGTLPVIVSARRPDPLVIPLDKAPARSYRHENKTFQFQIIQDTLDTLQVELIVTPDPVPSGGPSVRGPGLLRHHFAFEDRNGRPLSWLQFFQNSGSVNETRQRVTISGGQRPVRLRLYGLVQTTTEIPFEFADVPLP